MPRPRARIDGCRPASRRGAGRRRRRPGQRCAGAPRGHSRRIARTGTRRRTRLPRRPCRPG
ncbi:hypothetical protein NS206_17610 [Microbacterium testaceum]|nr:hypothetical protein NS206_17610 [Microbacterium testaceum]